MSSCRTTGPSPSRNNGGESIRDSGNVSSTPKLRSRTQIVTPATTTNEQTTSSTKGTGAHRRRSKRGCQSSERLTPPKSYFTDRQGKVTCLMFGLDPSNEAHKRVICVGCMRCVGNAIVVPDVVRNKTNHERNGNRKCEQPWHIGNEDHREERKEIVRRDFLALFDVDEPEVCADADINNKNNSTQPPSKRRRVQTKQNDAVMEDSWQLPPPPPIIFDEGGHFTKDAMEVIRTQLSSSYKSNDNPPNEDDMRVAGMLMLWIFKYSNNDSKVSLAKLSSFPTYRQFTVAKVPTTYDTEATARQTRERTKKASDWIDALMEGNFDTADVLVSLLDKNSKKKLPLKYIIKEWNANYRFDVDTTLHQELVLTDEVVADDVAVVNSDGSDDDVAIKVTENDTMIKICNHPGCGKMRLAMAWRIHQYECHEVVTTDTNSGEDMNVDG